MACPCRSDRLDSTDIGIIGPVTVMESFTARLGNFSSTVHGITVSCILLSASVSSFLAGKLADTLGRTRALAVGAIVFAFGAALEAGAVNLPMFAVGRVIEGMGEGLFFGTTRVLVIHKYCKGHF